MICVHDKNKGEVKATLSHFTHMDLSHSDIFQDICYSTLLIEGFAASRSCNAFLFLNSSLFNLGQQDVS